MMCLVRPKYFIPIHGEYRHLAHHARLAEMLGICKDNIFIIEDGDVIEFNGDGAVRKERCRQEGYLLTER